MKFYEPNKKPKPIHYTVFSVVAIISMFFLYKALVKLITLIGLL